MKTVMLASCLCVSLLSFTGCASKTPPVPSVSPTAPVRMSFQPEVEAFLAGVKQVQGAFNDKVAMAYQQGFVINQTYINPKVPLKERKVHAQNLIRLMKQVSQGVPEMQKQIEAIPGSPAVEEPKKHFVAHLAALKREADLFCVYAELACKSDNPGTDKKFQDCINKLNQAGGERQYELSQYQEGIKKLAQTPTPTP